MILDDVGGIVFAHILIRCLQLHPAALQVPSRCLPLTTASLCPISPKECLHSETPNKAPPNQYDPIFVRFHPQQKNFSILSIQSEAPSLLQAILFFSECEV